MFIAGRGRGKEGLKYTNRGNNDIIGLDWGFPWSLSLSLSLSLSFFFLLFCLILGLYILCRHMILVGVRDRGLFKRTPDGVLSNSNEF